MNWVSSFELDQVVENECYGSMNIILKFLPLIFTNLGKTILNLTRALFRLIAKYRPTMPVLSVVIPRLKTNQLKWSFSGAFEVSF